MNVTTSSTVVKGIDNTSAMPLYAQVSALLRERITSCEWPAGEQIPTETELCKAYRTSRITIRQALALLVREGLIVRGRGKGTFVRDARLTAAPRSVSSFSTEITALGMKPGSRIINVRVIPASPDCAAEMDLDAGTQLLRVRRLRTADDKPIGIQTALLVASRFEGLKSLLTNDVSLYGVIREHFGIIPSGATEVFKASGVTGDDAELLECEPDLHAFKVTRVTYDARGIFEYTTSIMRGDRYQIRIALQNPQ